MPSWLDLVEQPSLGGGGESEHCDDRGDPDRDAKGREPGAQPAGTNSDRGQAHKVAGTQPRRPKARGCGHRSVLTSANATGRTWRTTAVTM